MKLLKVLLVSVFLQMLLLAVTANAGEVVLDTTFNGNGYSVQSFGSMGSVAESVAVAPDGKVLLGGWTIAPAVYGDFLALRFLESGSLDTSFGTGGIVTSHIG
ncbi:MAG: delta-60 repeat domain-containing protein [Pyrinomonadaceae bacterium]